MKSSAIFASTFWLFSLSVPIWAKNWDTCVCETPNYPDWCSTAKACGNRKQNYRAIVDDRWCDADGGPIDGPEFHRNCLSKGATGSCCVAKNRHSDGCYGNVKRSLEELYKRTPDLSSLSLSEIKAAAYPRNHNIARQMDKREISLNCISPYGTSFKMAALELAVTLGSGLVTFALDQIYNGDYWVNVAITFLRGNNEVGYTNIQFTPGGVRTVPIPGGADSVVFLTN